MAVTWRESLNGTWAVVVVSDPFTMPEWRQALMKVCEHYPSRRSLHVLVDGRHCAPPTTDFVGRAITALEAHKQYRRVALVVHNAESYKKGLLAEAVVNIRKLPFELQTFSEWSAAEAWLEY